MSPDDLPFARRIAVMPSGCWQWTGKQQVYPVTRLNGRKIAAHRYVFERVNGYAPQVVMHKCDNPLCLNPEHLAAGTHVSNRADCVAKGRQARGERNGRSKLTAAQVAEIRSDGGCIRHLAQRYGVSDRCIRFILEGEHWQ